jgi:hypothetical protein
MKTQILTRNKKLPDDDRLMIETFWSDFKCFGVSHLNWSSIANKCISWTIARIKGVKTNNSMDSAIEED